MSANCRYQDAEVCDVGTAKDTGDIRFAVFFSPANPSVRERMLKEEQRTRAERGEVEAENYLVVEKAPHTYQVSKGLFSKKDDSNHWVWIGITPLMGESKPDYGGCTCPDFQHRCGPNGLKCKHFAIVEQHLAWDSVIKED